MRFLGICSKAVPSFYSFSARMLHVIVSFSPQKAFVKNNNNKKIVWKLFEIRDAPSLINEWSSYLHLYCSKMICLAETFRKWFSHVFHINYGVFQAFWPNLACVSPKYYNWIIPSYTVISCFKWWDWNVTFRKWPFHGS